MRTNINLSQLEEIASSAKVIREWVGKYSHPERYSEVKNLELVRDFVHTLDLLETVLIRFEISVHLSKLALEQLDNPAQVGSLGWEFLQIDIEEFFASNLLDLCYQLSKAWGKLHGFAIENRAFEILKTKPKNPSKTILARHKGTHFSPVEFQNHPISKHYSILRRPYHIQDGKLQKELAKETMPRVANLIQGAIQEGMSYLGNFRQAIIE